MSAQPLRHCIALSWRTADFSDQFKSALALDTETQLTDTLFIVYLSTGCPAKLFTLGYLLFCWLLLMLIAKVGTFLKNSGNLLE